MKSEKLPEILNFTFENSLTGEKPIDWSLNHMFGSSPKTILEDQKSTGILCCSQFMIPGRIEYYLNQVLQLEAVACKDWLTNKVDRSVTGRVAKQQSTGPLQLPLNDVAVMAMDYSGYKGIATSIGHAPVAALANPEAGSRLAIAESLTNPALRSADRWAEGCISECQLDVAGKKPWRK